MGGQDGLQERTTKLQTTSQEVLRANEQNRFFLACTAHLEREQPYRNRIVKGNMSCQLLVTL